VLPSVYWCFGRRLLSFARPSNMSINKFCRQTHQCTVNG
jgi:hypothetical protein